MDSKSIKASDSSVTINYCIVVMAMYAGMLESVTQNLNSCKDECRYVRFVLSPKSHKEPTPLSVADIFVGTPSLIF